MGSERTMSGTGDRSGRQGAWARGARRAGLVLVVAMGLLAASSGSAVSASVPGSEVDPSAPGAPQATGVAAFQVYGVTFGWLPPATDGGSPVTGYALTARTLTVLESGATSPGLKAATVDAATTTYLVPLDRGVFVTSFCVAAKNAVGTGPEACSTEWLQVGPTEVTCGYNDGTVREVARRAWVTGLPGAPRRGSRFTASVDPGLVAVGPETGGLEVASAQDIDHVVPIPAGAKLVSASLEGGTGLAKSTAKVIVGDGKVVLRVPGPVPSSTILDLPRLVLRLEATGAVGSVIAVKLAGTSVDDPGISFRLNWVGGGSLKIGCYSPGSPAIAQGAILAPAWSPFASADAFTTQQFADFAGRKPTAAELAAWRAGLVEGTAGASALIDKVRKGSYWEPVLGPVVRLYSAYFLRPPDTAGLTYWVGKRRAGTSLARISQAFASSKEFKARYGALSDAAFVNQVYRNVLGRDGDAGGIAFWVGELRSGDWTRGEVMVGFSESPENRTKMAPTVTVVSIVFGMLRRAPTKDEAEAGVRFDSYAIIGAVLLMSDYIDRVT